MLSKRQRQRHPGDKVDLENDGSTRSTDWQEACPLARMRHGLVGHVALNKGMQTTGDNNIDGNPGSYLSLLSIESLLVMQPRHQIRRLRHFSEPTEQAKSSRGLQPQLRTSA
jgi:hypothetical protein